MDIKACAELLGRPTDEVYFVTGSLLLIGELASLLIAAGQLDSRCFIAPIVHPPPGVRGKHCEKPNISN
jgi:hypothetical protein